jgi:hypothetical protein
MSAQQTLSGETVDEGAETPREHNVATWEAYTLVEIDPDTLPRDGWIEEVARRFEARRAGRDGWRTGDYQAELPEEDVE